MNVTQRNELVKVLGGLRMEGRELSSSMLDLHEALCQEQRQALERVCALEAEVRAIEQAATTPEEGGVFELHIGASVTLTPTVRERIKALGGKYTECRGHSETRFVHIPNTAEGRELTVKVAMAHVNRFESELTRGTIIVRPAYSAPGGSVDGVFYGTSWTVEKLSNMARNVNARGIRAWLAVRQRDLDTARAQQ